MLFIAVSINGQPRSHEEHEGSRMKLLKGLLRWLGMLFGPGGGTLDPFANRPVPVAPRPKGKSGAVALAEPDDD
jgi:hypothetical protein